MDELVESIEAEPVAYTQAASWDGGEDDVASRARTRALDGALQMQMLESCEHLEPVDRSKYTEPIVVVEFKVADEGCMD